MNIFVCMKRVPDTESQIQLAADGRSVDTAGLNYIINPYDEYAIEAALQLAEKEGGEVTLLTVGASDSDKTIRKGLAMGAQKAVLLDSGEDLADPAQVAVLLADYLKEQSADLVLCGKQGVDYDHAATGGMLAARLGIPCVSAIASLEVAEGKAKVQRDVEGASERFEVALPAVLTCDKGLNEPRYASLKGIMQAKKKPLEKVSVTPADSARQTEGMAYPPARPAGRVIGEGTDAVPELLRLLKEEAKVL